MKMKYDITAIGNALVDTQFKVSHEFIKEVGLEIDQMNLSSAEEHAPAAFVSSRIACDELGTKLDPNYQKQGRQDELFQKTLGTLREQLPEPMSQLDLFDANATQKELSAFVDETAVSRLCDTPGTPLCFNREKGPSGIAVFID